MKENMCLFEMMSTIDLERLVALEFFFLVTF